MRNLISSETYFRDKIDWKFYNYLLSKIVYLEDDGLVLNLNICVKTSTTYTTTYRSMYSYNSVDGETFSFVNSLNKYIELYNSNGLFYSIFPDNDDVKFDLNLLYSKINSRCLRFNSEMNDELIVKPKK